MSMLYCVQHFRLYRQLSVIRKCFLYVWHVRLIYALNYCIKLLLKQLLHAMRDNCDVIRPSVRHISSQGPAAAQELSDAC